MVEPQTIAQHARAILQACGQDSSPCAPTPCHRYASGEEPEPGDRVRDNKVSRGWDGIVDCYPGAETCILSRAAWLNGHAALVQQAGVPVRDLCLQERRGVA